MVDLTSQPDTHRDDAAVRRHRAAAAAAAAQLTASNAARDKLEREIAVRSSVCTVCC